MKQNRITNLMRSKVPRFLIIGLIALLLVFITMVYVFFRYAPLFVLESSGYAVNNKNISKNLQSPNILEEEKTIQLLPVEENDTIYRKVNNFFVGGEKKKEIDLNYPVYLNNNSSLLNLSKDMNLVTIDFEEVGGYPNFTISDGKMFNQGDSTRADSNEYLFLKNAEKIFCSLKEIKIKTVLNEYTIPLNSIMYFTEDFISYYRFVDKDKVKYEVIQDIDLKSNVTLNNNNYTYEELLIKLGIIQVNKTEEKLTNEENVIANEINNEVSEEQAEEKNDNQTEEDTKNKQVRTQKGYTLQDNRQKGTVSNSDNTNSSNSKKVENKSSNPQYIAPEVKCTGIEANVYTAIAYLNIYDPSATITKEIELSFYDETGRLARRAQVYTSGGIRITGLQPSSRYTVEGTYTYEKENGDKAIKTFYNGEIETKSMDILETINLSFENGELYPNKIELANIKINNDLSSEVLFGLKKITITAQNNEYNIKNLTSLKQGKQVKFETDTNLKSNSNVEYKIKAYDDKGRELKLSNNSGKTRTSMNQPHIGVTISKRDYSETRLKIVQINNDNVKINNFRYSVYTDDGSEIKTESLSTIPSEIILKDLDPNRYFIIRTYGDYDLKDNKGTNTNVMLGEGKFSTLPISSLGLVYYNLEYTDITFNTCNIKLNIDTGKTDTRLQALISSVKIKIMDENNREFISKELNEDELLKLIDGNEIEYFVDTLNSNEQYKLEIETKAKQGTVEESVKLDIDYNTFKTNKMPATVQVENLFVTEEMIDFDVRIEDIDNAIFENAVSLEVRDQKGNLVAFEKINTNEDFYRKIIDKLNAHQKYMITFMASEYNETDNNKDYKANYILKQLEVETVEGISGTIQLYQLNKKETGKNLVDMSSEIKWYVYPNFNSSEYYGKTYDEVNKILNIGGHNNNRRCVYDLQEYAGKEVTISFKARALNTNFGIGKFYLQNARTDKNREQLNGINDKDWKDFSRTVTIDESGFLGFYVNGGDGLQIKELQIELGPDRTLYQEYQYDFDSHLLVNLTDSRKEIDKYYLRIYKDDELQSPDLEYADFDENHVVKDVIKQFKLDKKSKKYRFELLAKIKEREYVLSAQNVDVRSGEIRGIYSLDDYKLIQPNGNYIVFCDLDLSDPALKFGYTWDDLRIAFRGILDFNGHTVTRKITNNYNYGMFGYLGKDAIIKNLVLNIVNDNDVEVREFYGLFYGNYGTVENLQVNLVECTEKENLYINFIGNNNRGTINKFVINNQVPFYTNNVSSCGVYTNYGIIKNGYLYGEPITVIGDAPEEFKQERKIGALACTSTGSAIIQNVYSLINVNIINQSNEGKENTANLVCDNFSSIKNVYSVGVGNTIQKSGGPTVYTNSGKIEECYYFTDDVFANDYNKKTSKIVLVDPNVGFHETILNSEGAFNVNEMVVNGYYPRVYMDDCMPRQDFIKLPEIENRDLADLLSCNVIKQGSDSVEVEFEINNPSGEYVEDIYVQNLTTTINSQVYENGISKVIATLTNPTKYISSYNVLRITTKSAFGGIPLNNNYKENERTINVDLYRQIKSIADWKDIQNHLDENYMLLTDLDFKNEESSISILDTYYGKIEGFDGETMHHISNIRSSKGLFSKLNGKISNLYIDRYINTETDKTNIGLVEELDGGIIDNVHMSDVQLEPKKTKVGTDFFAGGLAGYALNGATIMNSSVTNPEIKVNQMLATVRLGGIVGYGVSTIINNCYVQNADISTENEITSDGIGGLVGRGDPTYISNCYTTGKLFSDGNRNGGIVGYAQSNGSVEHCYSMVNVSSNGDYIGGISGYNVIPNGTIAIGSVYTKLETKNVGRISGYNINRIVNYAYSRQAVNGYISSDNMDADLLTYDELFDRETYGELLKWDNNFNYEQLADGILPKLYNTNHRGESGGELPNQADNRIEKESDITVESIDYDKKPTSVDIRITVTNPAGLEITKVDIDDMEIQNFDVRENTMIFLTATPKKYYDSYKFTKLYYIENGKEKSINLDKRIDTMFYYQIYNTEQWQGICKGENENTYQNYMLMNDLDFSEVNNVNYNVTMAKLETQGENEEDAKTIRNVTISNVGAQSGFIKKISVNIQNIKFDNIKIYTGNNTGNYVGVIRKVEGKMKDIDFSNIVIQGGTEGSVKNNKLNYTGCLAETNAETRNVTLNTVDISGSAYVGGFSARTINLGRNITAENMHIKATSSYCGGIVGVNSRGAEHIHYDITIKNSEVLGNNYTGGIAGQTPNLMGATVLGETPTTDSNGNKKYTMVVKGATYTGGMAGNLTDGIDSGSYVSRVENVEVSGGNSTGGLAGYSSDWWGAVRVVKNCLITGTTNAGGVYGQCRAMCNNVFSIDNTITAKTSSKSGTNANITGNANNVGGIAGYLYVNCNNANRWVTDNATIRGNSNVGGIAGYSRCGKINNSYANADIEASVSNAGGIIGYMENTGMTAATATSGVIRVMTLGSKIKAPYNVGGIYGKVDADLYRPDLFFNSLYVDADVEATLQSSTNQSSILIGNMRSRNSQLLKTYVYNGCKLNNQTISTSNDVIKANQLWSVNQLKTASTYSAIISGNWQGYNWNTGTVSTGYYPKINGFINYQRGIKLPSGASSSAFIDNEPISDNDTNSGSAITEKTDLLIKSKSAINELPEYVIYPISVDKLNIDFKKIDENAIIKINVDGEEKVNEKIVQKTFTFNYDYKSNLAIGIEKGTVAKITSTTPEQIRRNIALVGENAVYLKGHKLVLNGQEKDGEFVNLYDNKALKADGTIMNIETQQIESTKVIDKLELNEVQPQFSYDYNGNSISTYGTYSIVNANFKSQRYFVKNDKLSIIDGSIDNKIGNFVIDSFNGKDYQTVLGNDGKLYDYMNYLKYPKNFYNSEIKEIVTNYKNDMKEILVMYDNGKVVCFDYSTGAEKFREGENSEIGLLDYLKDNLLDTDNLINKLNQEYEDILQIQSKLEQTPIEELLENISEEPNNASITNVQENQTNSTENITNATPSSNKYTAVYNANTKEYEIYREDKLFNSNEEKTISETEIIKNTDVLSKYYLNPRTENVQNSNKNGLVYFGLSIIAIGCTLILLNRINIRKRRRGKTRKK